MILEQDYSNLKKELGEVQFSKTKIDDAHVKKAVDLAAKATNVPPGHILAKINEEVNKYADLSTKAPILYATIANNAIESAIFNEMWDKKIDVKGAPKFKLKTFNELNSRIKVEHEGSLFPLRNVHDHLKARSPNLIIVPSDDKVEQDKFGSVDTAAATADGDFIFNRDFMQRLIDWAYLKDVKPKSKKYESNGGDIPDAYTYIEFLILHEYMHYVHADFHNQETYDLDPTLVNWVGDFRSNYQLVKNGHDQLPMGLFSDHVNLDRQYSFREMYELVKKEFEKLNDKEKDQVKDALDKMTDQHEQKPSKGNSKPTEQETEEAGKRTKEKMEKNAGKKDGEKPAEEGKGKAEGGKGDKNGKSGENRGGSNGSDKFDYNKIRPTFGWKQLLRKMVASQSVDSYETYQKPNRRSVTSMDIAQQTGAAAVKPGEVLKDTDLKLCFIVDSSGSMSHVLPKIYSNIDSLLKQSAQNDISPTFWMFKFSSQYEKYICNSKTKKYAKVATMGDKVKLESGSISELFSMTFGAGTTFAGELVEDTEGLLKKKYNVCCFFDNDITWSENFENLRKLHNMAKQQIFVVFDSRDTFVKVCSMLKQVPATFTYFEDK
jgi:hypothetical protein